jgi:L-ascorbate metabolism protein UlaG (beta-lactamase superfamily)
MRLTKLEHSCVRIEGPSGILTVDPGIFADAAKAIDGAAAVLITHEHPDHLDLDALVAAATREPQLRIYAPAVVVAQLSERGIGENVVAVGPGESFDAVGLPIRTVGGQHAMIHISMPVVANVGYLIGPVGEAIYHPGDALLVPSEHVRTLLAPIAAPWSKVGEVIDFVVAVRSDLVHQMHEAVASPAGLGMAEGLVARVGAGFGAQFAHLDIGTSIDA